MKILKFGPSEWRPINRVLRGHGATMAMLGTVSLVGALLEAGFLILMTGTILALANGQDRLTPVLGVGLPLGLALAIGVVAIFVRLGLSLIGVRLSAALSAKITSEQRDRLAQAYLRAPWPVQHAEPTGRLQELLSTFVGKATQTAQAVVQGITSMLSIVAFLGTGLVVDPLLTVGVLIVLMLLASILTPLRNRVRRAAWRATDAGLDLAKAVSELGSLGQEMHAFGAQAAFVQRLSHLSIAAVEQSRRVQFTQGILTPAYTSMAYAAILGGMTALWATGVSDLAAVGAVMLLMLRSLSYAQQLLTVSGQLAANVAPLERLHRTWADYTEATLTPGDQVPEHVTPLELDDVGLTYDGNRAAIEHVSATIRPGELIGIIGPSGAGKSTLAQLILGLRNPTVGRILVSGHDLREVDREWWTHRVAFVPQDPGFMTGTVAENLRFLRTHISSDSLLRAAAQANVLADIQDLPQGLDTHLGERGSQVSGGQRQRLSIARALAGSPELLIMDEPTSALDGKSESLIRQTMSELHGHITIVVIAHRMSTLDLCDKIMVIEHGRVTGFDRPDRLLASNRYYQQALHAAGLTPTSTEARPT